MDDNDNQQDDPMEVDEEQQHHNGMGDEVDDIDDIPVTQEDAWAVIRYVCGWKS